MTLGKPSVTPGSSPFCSTCSDFRHQETKSVVRAGLNLRFGGWSAPVAAR